MLVAQPEIPTDRTKAVLVLLPVPLKAGQTYSASLDDCPSTSILFHITVHLNTARTNSHENVS